MYTYTHLAGPGLRDPGSGCGPAWPLPHWPRGAGLGARMIPQRKVNGLPCVQECLQEGGLTSLMLAGVFFPGSKMGLVFLLCFFDVFFMFFLCFHQKNIKKTQKKHQKNTPLY